MAEVPMERFYCPWCPGIMTRTFGRGHHPVDQVICSTCHYRVVEHWGPHGRDGYEEPETGTLVQLKPLKKGGPSGPTT